MNSEKAFQVVDYFRKNMNLAIYSKIFEWIEEVAFDDLIKNPLQQQSGSTCENAFSPLFQGSSWIRTHAHIPKKRYYNGQIKGIQKTSFLDRFSTSLRSDLAPFI